MSLSVTLYNTASDNLKVAKSLSTIGTYSCDLLEECSVSNPSIIVNAGGSIATCNYAYISAWHRYYWAHPIVLDGYRIRLDLTVDPLMSFVNPNKGSIQAYIERNENTYNKHLFDNQAVFDVDRDYIIYKLTSGGDTRRVDNYKLIGVFNAGLCNGQTTHTVPTNNS